MLLSHALALSPNHFFYARKSPYQYVHSVRIELAKLILVGTRITYQATGDAGSIVDSNWYGMVCYGMPPRNSWLTSRQNYSFNSIGIYTAVAL